MSASYTRIPAKIPLLLRPTNPPILPIPTRRHGNNVPHSLHKTRRTWRPNVKRFDLPVNVIADALERSEASRAALEEARGILGGVNKLRSSKRLIKAPSLKGVKMLASDIKDVEKAGGIEGVLLSRPASHFTKFGKLLRSQLFNDLHRIRDDIQAETLAAQTSSRDHEAAGQIGGSEPLQVADK